MLRRFSWDFVLIFVSVMIQATQSCPDIERDLVILLDSSGSITQPDFVKAKEFLASYIKELDINDNAYQVAVVRFSNVIRREAALGQFNCRKSALMKKVQKIYHNGGGTATDKAIQYTLERVLTINNREDAPDQILILTDGKSDDAKATARQIRAARAQNVQMISVGVGKGVNDTELRNLASSDTLMFKVDTYADLSTIKAQLVLALCEVITTTPTTTATTPTTPTTSTTPTSTTVTTPATSEIQAESLGLETSGGSISGGIRNRGPPATCSTCLCSKETAKLIQDKLMLEIECIKLEKALLEAKVSKLGNA